MAHVAWTLTDNSSGTPEVYEFPINPNEFKPPGRRANITQESSTAPNGALVVFQGRDGARTGRMSGAVMSEQHYTDLLAWFDKWYPLVLQDDLGQTFNILITSVDWDRLRRAQHPWRFDYSVEFLVF